MYKIIFVFLVGILSYQVQAQTIIKAPFPQYDTVNGLVIYYDSDLIVKVDSAIHIKISVSGYMEAAKPNPDGTTNAVAVYKPLWYTHKIVLYRQKRELPINQLLNFIPDK
ncbi:hypothetical protein KKH23_07080 [Patescibacteria group bacterium]|uniref:Uncharacterized protein n=1 Tax=viral metagenome TaxID=1070528 RepID=A0A6M3LXZ6_9ZZZZ|nr:hypothetical protein [Patescibacteria group bacterium]